MHGTNSWLSAEVLFKICANEFAINNLRAQNVTTTINNTLFGFATLILWACENNNFTRII
jgi:hypothetical protein